MKFSTFVAKVVISLLSASFSTYASPASLAGRGLTGQYLQPFTVFYGSSPSDQPDPRLANVMREINGKSNDINAGFGGSYVYILINRTDLQERIPPMEDFTFTHGSCALMALQCIYCDLAKGAGGDCRWLLAAPKKRSLGDISGPDFLTDAALWRAPGATTIPPSGWKYISADLNGGRGGDYLYIVSHS